MKEERKDKENPIVAGRITPQLYRALQECLQRDSHISESDFVRDAVRELIRTKYPGVYRKYFGGLEGEVEK